MYYTVVANTDLTTKPKKLKSWHFSNSHATIVGDIELRNGSATGDVVVKILLPAVSGFQSRAYSYPEGLIFPIGLYVKVNAGTIVGSVDL